MRISDIDPSAVERVVQELPRVFHTKNVSLNREVRLAHQVHEGERAYNSVFGRFLRRNEVQLGIRLDKFPGGSMGARWRKTS